MKRIICSLFFLIVSGATAQKVGNLSWLHGAWEGSFFGNDVKLSFSQALGTRILGESKIGGRRSISYFDFMEIIETNDGLVLKTFPMGSSERSYQLKEIGAQLVIFANSSIEMPSEIEFRVAEDGIIQRLSGIRNGSPFEIEIDLEAIEIE